MLVQKAYKYSFFPTDLKNRNCPIPCAVIVSSVIKNLSFGRASTDGVDFSYLYDIELHPNFQGHGLEESYDKTTRAGTHHRHLRQHSARELHAPGADAGATRRRGSGRADRTD